MAVLLMAIYSSPKEPLQLNAGIPFGLAILDVFGIGGKPYLIPTEKILVAHQH